MKKEKETEERVFKFAIFLTKLFVIMVAVGVPLCIILLITGHLIEEPRITIRLVGEVVLMVAVGVFLIYTSFRYIWNMDKFYAGTYKHKEVKE